MKIHEILCHELVSNGEFRSAFQEYAREQLGEKALLPIADWPTTMTAEDVVALPPTPTTTTCAARMLAAPVTPYKRSKPPKRRSIVEDGVTTGSLTGGAL